MRDAPKPFTVAAVQMRSTADRAGNLRTAAQLAARAADRGARLIAFPENVAGVRAASAPPLAGEPLDGRTSAFFAAMAQRHAAWILAGTIALRSGRRGKPYNASLLFAPDGSVASVYRKLHLFDVAIPGRAEFRESAAVARGRDTVVARTELGALGLSVCYDLRFPELYRRLALDGAQVFLVPSAFTAYTGRAHWHALLRARAIENLAYVVAPAQWGTHRPGRVSYGHACVIDPWGRIVAERAGGSGCVLARIDTARVDRLRREFPVLRHVRDDLLPRPSRSR